MRVFGIVLAMVLGLTAPAFAQVDDETFARPANAEPDALRVRLATELHAHGPAETLRAIRALPEAERLRGDVRVLHAHLAVELSEHADVATALEGFRTLLPPMLHGWALDARVRALLFLGQTQAAVEEIAASQTAGAALSWRVRALHAEALFALGQYAQSEAALLPVVREDPADVDTFALRLMQAECARALGESARGATVLRTLLVARPQHSDADATERLLASWLGQAAVPWTSEERIARAARFVTSHRAQRAVEELEPLPRPREDAALRAWLEARASALYESRHYVEAAALYAESARLTGNARHRFLAARATLRAGQDDEAITAFRAFIRDEPRHASATEAEWLVGATLLRGGRMREARQALSRFVRGPRGSRSQGLRREALWHLALLDLDDGHPRDAADAFRAWGADATTAIDRARARYWEGRAAFLAHDASRAERLYREAIQSEALGWYALMAASRLVEMGEAPGHPMPNDAPSEAMHAPIVEPAIVRLYASLGLDAEAAQALRARERGLTGSRRAFVERLQELGDANRGYRLAGVSALLGSVPVREAEWVWHAAYPRPYERDVRAAASAAGLTPELLYAVMRQESAFDPRVVSYADAIGLMQLLPDTARRYAEGSFGREMLYQPAENVRLGAAYMHALEDEIGMPLCFAAYNAGEHRVREWLQRARRDGGPRGLELDRFVENIPFEQTRNYIRRVTASYAHYLYLNNPDAGWPVLNLPERVGAAP
jgi:soluble lytic murein transglycosylase